MAIYRSDQATVTFAAEGSPGAYPELADISSSINIGESVAVRRLRTATIVGATSIELENVSSVAATCGEDSLLGNNQFMIVIGGTTAAHGPQEVRKVVDGYDTNTLTLDHPLAFAHGDETPIKGLVFHPTNVDSLTTQALTSPAYTSHDLITWLPGVYDAIDVPDPEQAFEPYYILGGQNRNAYVMYPGQETLAGSIGGMVLLNATPLRFPLGSMVTLPAASAAFTSPMRMGTSNSVGGSVKGATVINAFSAGSMAAVTAGTLICLGSDDGVGVGAEIDATDFSILPKSTYEVRRLMRNSANSDGTPHTFYLDTPLQFAHNPNEIISNVTGSTYYHTIWEKTALDSITMNVSVLDSDETAANTWQRRYVGGKVGSMTIAAEEGGLVNCGWDSMLFLDMIHNMKQHPELPTAGTEMFMPRYGAMSIINPSSVGKPTYNATTPAEPLYTRPSTAPYYFSQGEINFYGDNPKVGSQVMGRVRSFSITVANSEEPRYYLSKQREGKRGPTEILEQRREYTMSATIAMDDSSTAAVGVGSDAASARNIFKELLLAGDYRTSTNGGLRGFAIVLTFSRSTTDKIEIHIPGENFANNSNEAGTSNTTGQVTSTGGEQGAFIRAAAHNIGDTNPIEADVDIIFRSMIINIQDSEPVYP